MPKSIVVIQNLLKIVHQGKQEALIEIKDFNLSAGLTWSIDIWGKIKREKEEALANYLQCVTLNPLFVSISLYVSILFYLTGIIAKP